MIASTLDLPGVDHFAETRRTKDFFVKRQRPREIRHREIKMINSQHLWQLSLRRFKWKRARNHSGALAGHASDVYGVAFSPDGKTLASASEDTTLKLWDVATGTEIRALAGHTSDVVGVAFSPDSKTLASASRDATLKLWWAVRQPRLSEPSDATDASE